MIKYKLCKTPDGTVYPLPTNTRHITPDELCELLAKKSVMTAAEIRLVIQEMTHLIAEKLTDGCSVTLPELGTLSVGLKTKKHTLYYNEVRTSDVKAEHVNFKIHPELKCKLNECQVRLAEGDSQKRKVSSQERLEILKAYLSGHRDIDVRTYIRISGATEYTARKELKEWTENGLLVKQERRNLTLFYLKG